MSNKRVHILGVCGTFMGGVALLARDMGWVVTGADNNVYPPMSRQLEEQGIALIEGYAVDDMPKDADLYVVGNALSRGNACVEYILDQHLPYTSGPEFLYRSVLAKKKVLAVAGTHGKTTTSSLLAWILTCSGEDVGFLIGGIPDNFGVSSRLGESAYFVVEADEYDTAFFDKRSKFVHYHPDTLILNNLEYDHADIFDSIDDIKKQFHHLLRTIPSAGQIIMAADEPNLDSVISMGCWTPVQQFGLTEAAKWQARLLDESGSHFEVLHEGRLSGVVQWSLIGNHNVKNALAAIAAAYSNGVSIEEAIEALLTFKGVKRRMEILYQDDSVVLYDDFAHHPTAISTTLCGLRRLIGAQQLIALFEPRSNSLRQGVHQSALPQSFSAADEVYLLQPSDAKVNISSVAEAIGDTAKVFSSAHEIIMSIPVTTAQSKIHIIIMSNGSFDGIRDKLVMKFAGMKR